MMKLEPACGIEESSSVDGLSIVLYSSKVFSEVIEGVRMVVEIEPLTDSMSLCGSSIEAIYLLGKYLEAERFCDRVNCVSGVTRFQANFGYTD
jgi:hypothetical protein